MADFVLDNPRVEVNALNYTSNVKTVNISMSREQLDATAMGHTAKGSRLGLHNTTITMDLYNDVADNGIDELLWDLLNNRTAVTFKIRHNAAAAISAGNAEYQFSSVYIASLTPINGSVGEMEMNRVEIVLAPGCTIVRAVA